MSNHLDFCKFGRTADVAACAADAEHWLKLMAAWDENVNLKAQIVELEDECSVLRLRNNHLL